MWKQIKGEVDSFDGTLLTLFDGISNWTFKVDPGQTDALLFQAGSTLLVQAVMENGLYKIMTSELISGAAKSQKSSFPWALIGTALLTIGWISYEVYKKRQKSLHFEGTALN